MNQWKRENGRRNFFMTKSPRKNVPGVGIELGAACMPNGHASDELPRPALTLSGSVCRTSQEYSSMFYHSE